MPPITVMVKPVSGACNMRCGYCFYTDVMARRGTAVYPRMTPEILEAVVRRAFSYADGQVSFAFQGGEPALIGLGFYETFMRLERRYNVRSLPVSNAVQTNGLQISDEMISFFAQEHFLVGVSMDGFAEAHDRLRVDSSGGPTFERVCGTVRRLSDAGVDFNILCVVNDFVAREPRKVFQNLSRYGYIQFISCLDDLDGGKKPYSLRPEHYLTFLKTTFDLYYQAFMSGHPVSIRNFDNYIGMMMGIPPENCALCGRCGQYFLVESDGSVYPCDFYVLDQWKLGSVLDSSFYRLAASERALRFRSESLPVPAQCRACQWYPLCRNGCRRERNPETGVNIWCDCFREFFAFSADRMSRIAASLRKQ